MSNHTTLCANVLCANSAKMNGLVLETSSDSNTGAITSSTDSVPLLTLKNTNTDANSAAVVQLKSHPSDNVQTDADEIGLISFVGVDAAGATAEYGAILCSAPDTDASGEEGKLSINLAVAGARTEVMSLTAGTTAATSVVSIAGSTRISGELALTQSVATVTPVAAATPNHGAYDAGATISTTSSIVTATGGANTQIYLPSPTSVPDGKVYVIINTTTGNAIELGSLGDASTATTINNVAVTAANGNYAAEVALAAKSTFLAVKVGANAWGLIGHTVADADS